MLTIHEQFSLKYVPNIELQPSYHYLSEHTCYSGHLFAGASQLSMYHWTFRLLSFFVVFTNLTNAMHIVAISGSLRKTSCNTGILRAIKEQLPLGHTMDIIVPDLPLFNQDLERPDIRPEIVNDFRNRLKAADAFLFGLSEYNFSMSGAAKNAIDWGSRGADGGNLFNDKAAAVVSAGGGVGGQRAAAHFRDSALFLNLHVMNKPDLSTRIFQNPSPFNLETGDLVGADERDSALKVVEALVEWTKRLSPK